MCIQFNPTAHLLTTDKKSLCEFQFAVLFKCFPGDFFLWIFPKILLKNSIRIVSEIFIVFRYSSLNFSIDYWIPLTFYKILPKKYDLFSEKHRFYHTMLAQIILQKISNFSCQASSIYLNLESIRALPKTIKKYI